MKKLSYEEEMKELTKDLTVKDKKVIHQMMDVWGMSPEVAAVAKRSSKLFSYKHGMFASAPIVCRGDQCPFYDVCSVDPMYRIVGSRCPQEAGVIISRFEQWCKHFKINFEGDEVAEEDLVDASLIRDLVENEVQILRAENKIALNGDIVKKTLQSVDQRGNTYYEDAVTPEATYKLQLQEKRYKLLNLLNSTRKDKASERRQLTPSEEALSIFNKLNQKVDLDAMELEENEKNEG